MLRSLIGKVCEVAIKLTPHNGARVRLQRVKGVKIGSHVYLGYDVHIDVALPGLVEIEDHARIGPGVIIMAHARPGDPWLGYLGEQRAKVVIRRHAAIYPGSIVMPGVTVGECAIVRAGSVVESDVPPFTVVGGAPARVLEELPREKAEMTGHPGERAMRA
jgi:acetyltransferase-like isoleucine patch superfamily enzyme